jgi:hypothetical protein
MAVRRLDACHPYGLVGSSISRLKGTCSAEVSGRLNDLFPSAGRVSISAVWTAERRDAIMAMTDLVVTGGSCPIKEGHRRLLCEIDLSALGDLPAGLSLQRCVFLRRVRLPARVRVIPAEMFYQCEQLKEVGLGECQELREIGTNAFANCWNLRDIDVPRSCLYVRFEQSGLHALDLRYCLPLIVGTMCCVRLASSFRGELMMGVAISLRAVTLGRLTQGQVRNVLLGSWPDEVRCVSSSFLGVLSWCMVLSRARVFGEVAAMGGRSGGPALPC